MGRIGWVIGRGRPVRRPSLCLTLARPLGPLFTVAELERLGAPVDRERRRRDLAGATLARGDFDTTAIFQVDGDYSGLIDFGEL